MKNSYSHRIILSYLFAFICIASIAEIKTLCTSKDGFKYYLIEKNNDVFIHTVNVVSLVGDTIISISGFEPYTHIDFQSDSIFGGYFIAGNNKIIDLNGNTILSKPNSYPSLKRTNNGKAYFKLSLSYDQYAFYDLDGKFLLKFKNNWPKYDELRNEFYLLKNGKRKYLNVGLPNLDYAAIAERNKQIIKKSMDNSGKVVITDKEIDGFYYKEVRMGQNVCILNFKGDTIMPLNRHYSVTKYMTKI